MKIIKNIVLRAMQIMASIGIVRQKRSKDVQAVIVKNLQDPEFLILKRLNKNSGVYEFRLVKGGI